MTTIFIAPAFSEQAGQCRVYSTGSTFSGEARDHYAKHPELWLECGLMNSQGRLVCFEGAEAQRQELVDCQPLMAGTAFTFTN